MVQKTRFFYFTNCVMIFPLKTTQQEKEIEPGLERIPRKEGEEPERKKDSRGCEAAQGPLWL